MFVVLSYWIIKLGLLATTSVNFNRWITIPFCMVYLLVTFMSPAKIQLNQSRCQLEGRLRWTQGTVYWTVSTYLNRKGQF